MKEDILEQIVDDCFLSQSGIFTKHNIKFRPDKKRKDYNSKMDSSHSDIDILAVNLNKQSNERVLVVTCKSWQQGFNLKNWADWLVNNQSKKFAGREAWKFFRELVRPNWTEAFIEKIKEETGSNEFIYYIACTKINGENNKKIFEKNDYFLNNLSKYGAKNPIIKIITFEDMFKKNWHRTNKQTLEATQVGRLLQLMKASNVLKDKFDSSFE